MPVDLNRLTDGWLELESDPGLFTLLLEDFGVRGVQVEEIYDLQKSIEGPVYGFIFLFRWIEERRSRRKMIVPEECFVQDESVVNSIFFAHQVVPNSCATHALLSVLLNCYKIHLGETLTRLKEYTKNMSPENKGYAIGNTPELAKAHNSHAKPEPRRLHEKSHGIPASRTIEAFHFVSYVPINGQLFELDGLKPHPINHGPWGENEDWTEKFRRAIIERLGMATGDEPMHDIRFNLMAVVPDRRIAYEHKLRTLKTNRQIVLEALQQLVKMTHPELTSDDQAEYMAAVIRNKNKANADQAAASASPSKAAPSASGHPALEGHNYAKNPHMECDKDTANSRPRYEEVSGSDYATDEDGGADGKAASLGTSRRGESHPKAPLNQPVHVDTSKDYSRPLSIQTKFEASPTPSNSSSTDTSSEVGSAFNSPVRTFAVGSALSSPNLMTSREFRKLVVVRVSSSKEGNHQDTSPKPSVAAAKKSTNSTEKTEDEVKSKEHIHSRYPQLMEPHRFAPKDLLALLKNVETEIATCETNLRDEIEKRKKYKIDDYRRTHNYDEFICTFLSLLAQQGKLADLVQQNVLVKRRQGIHVGRLHKKTDKRRRSRPKKRK
uniref:Ubiquitin carboxyl-terminal hydrolase n=1 Tax=Strigamia maritima TaxID=126957 RepID=T1IWJ3_STRMM